MLGAIRSASPSAFYQGMYGWNGYDYDAATKFYNNHARFYDPQSQRWMSQDPMGFDAGDSNLYRYVNNAPTNGVDPSGFDVYRIGGDGNDKNDWAVAHSMANLKAEIKSVLDAANKKGIKDWLAVGMFLANGIHKNRFVWTKEGGFIDMRHFFAAAFNSLRFGSSKGAVENAGLGVEKRQAKSGDPGEQKSGFAFEDLPSNRMGTRFSEFINTGDLAALPGVVEKFIDDQLGGLLPPPTDKIDEFNNIRNFSDAPILDPKGKDILTDPRTKIKYKSSEGNLSFKWADPVAKDRLYLELLEEGLKKVAGKPDKSNSSSAP